MAPLLTPATLQALQAALTLGGGEVDSACVIEVFNDPPEDDASSNPRPNPSTTDPQVRRALNAATQLSPEQKEVALQLAWQALDKKQKRTHIKQELAAPGTRSRLLNLCGISDSGQGPIDETLLAKLTDIVSKGLQHYRDELLKRMARLEDQRWQYVGKYEFLKEKLDISEKAHADAKKQRLEEKNQQPHQGAQAEAAFAFLKMQRGWTDVESLCNEVKQEQETLQSDKKRLNVDWETIGKLFVVLYRYPGEVAGWMSEHLDENYGNSADRTLAVKNLLRQEMEVQMQEMEMLQQRRRFLGMRFKIVKEQLFGLSEQVQSALERQERMPEQPRKNGVLHGLQQLGHRVSDALHLNTLEWTKADLEGTLEQCDTLLKTLQQRFEELKQLPYDPLLKECSVDELKERYVDFLQRIDVEENRIKQLGVEKAELLHKQEKVNSVTDTPLHHKKLEAAELEKKIKSLETEELQQQEKVAEMIRDTVTLEREQLKRYLEQKGVSVEELEANHESHKQQFALQTHLAGEMKKHLKNLDLREANLQAQHYLFDDKLKLLQEEHNQLRQETQHVKQESHQSAGPETVDKLQHEWAAVERKCEKVKREQQALECEKKRLWHDWEAARAVLNLPSQSPPHEMQALAHREQETLWEEEKMLQQRREIVGLRFKIVLKRLHNLNEQLRSEIQRHDQLVEQPRKTNAQHDLQQLAHLVDQARHLTALEHTKATLEGKVEHSDVLLMRLQPVGIHTVESSHDSQFNQHSVDELKKEYSDLLHKFDAQENGLKKLRDAKAKWLHEQEKVNSVVDAKQSQQAHLKEEIRRLKGESLDKEEKLGKEMLNTLMEKREELERCLEQKGACFRRWLDGQDAC